MANRSAIVATARLVVLCLCVPETATAQARRPGLFEAIVDAGARPDDSLGDHTVFGAAFLVPNGKGVSLGPEVSFFARQDGTIGDTDLSLAVAIDLRKPAATPRRVEPLVTVGGGVRFFQPNAIDPLLTAGFGVRIRVGDNVYLTPEYRVSIPTMSSDWIYQIVGVRVGFRLR